MWQGVLEFFCHASEATSNLGDALGIMQNPGEGIAQKAGDAIDGLLSSTGTRKAIARVNETGPLPALLQSAYDKLSCYFNYYSTLHSYRVEMTGAPEALAIEGDFYASLVED